MAPDGLVQEGFSPVRTRWRPRCAGRRWAGEATPRQVHHRHRVLDGDQLFARGPHVAIGAPERRQDQRGAAVDDVTAVEFGRDLHRELATAQCGLGHFGIGVAAAKFSAHSDEHLRVAVTHRPDRIDGVVAMLAGSGDAEARVQRRQERFGHLLPDAHGAVALHVGVSADGAHPGAGLADHAPHQKQVRGLADGDHRVPLLGQAHRPADHRALGRGE